MVATLACDACTFILPCAELRKTLSRFNFRRSPQAILDRCEEPPACRRALARSLQLAAGVNRQEVHRTRKEPNMTRTILTMATIAGLMLTSAASAQVIGTYRPSVVTYYPHTTSAAPATFQARTMPITPVGYYPTTTVAAPITTLGGPQVVSPLPVTHASYYGAPPAASGCGCTGGGVPVAPIVATSYSPAPVACASACDLGGNRFVGRSVWGSPKVYANGQPVRNALRWLGP
jgi:hypothetical protein